jgi:hypothetical protein
MLIAICNRCNGAIASEIAISAAVTQPSRMVVIVLPRHIGHARFDEINN